MTDVPTPALSKKKKRLKKGNHGGGLSRALEVDMPKKVEETNKSRPALQYTHFSHSHPPLPGIRTWGYRTHTHTHMKKKEIVSLMGDGRMGLREPCRSSLGTASLSVSVDRERGQNKGQHERALTLGGLMVRSP